MGFFKDQKGRISFLLVPAYTLGHFIIQVLGRGNIGPGYGKGGGPLDGQTGFSTAYRAGDEGQSGIAVDLRVQNKKSLSPISGLKDGTQLT